MNLFEYGPLYAGLMAGIFTLLYLTMITISPNLPPAIMVSVIVFYMTFQYHTKCAINRSSETFYGGNTYTF